ncbi:MAG: 6-carboxytetrahydropterin synthase QueD [Sporomusaceae bacterium]|nr:6-carboxytetrahydropterin synthase QueD [Sporomusaceae bacterium]
MAGLLIKATKIFTFDAAHFLEGHKGKCASLHGHSYRLEVTVSQRSLTVDGGSSDGMVIDFSDLKAIVHELIIDRVDHKLLNDVYPFRTTSENLAAHFYRLLEARLRVDGIQVERVKLWESATSYVEVEA